MARESERQGTSKGILQEDGGRRVLWTQVVEAGEDRPFEVARVPVSDSKWRRWCSATETGPATPTDEPTSDV